MEIDQILKQKPVIISNHGRVTIPANYRKKFLLKDGDEVVFIEDEGSLRMIKVVSLDELRAQSIPAEEVLKILEKARQEDIELENK